MEDWKQKLYQLKNSMPQAEEILEEIKTQSQDEKDKKQSAPIRVVTDKKGRNGKTATIIEGFTIPQSEVEKLAKQLKQKFGVGGSTRDGEILIQGDHKIAITEFLRNCNFKVK